MMLFRSKLCLVQCVLPFVFLAITAGTVHKLYSVFGPIDVANADARQLLIWIYFRDFANEPEHVSTDVLHRLVELHGPGIGQPPVFAFDEEQKKQIKQLMPPIGQLSPSPSENDPPRIRSAQTKLERNIRILARTWLFERMKEYEAAERKGTGSAKEQLKTICKEIDGFTGIYIDFMNAAELPIPTLLEQLKEIDGFINDIKRDSSPQDAVRIDRFYRKLMMAYALNRIQSVFFN